MAKDPAFLFYSADFMMGTALMNETEVGQYIRILCHMHQSGHLSMEDILNISPNASKRVLSKFSIDSDGKYFNKRLDSEIEKRRAYTESRRRSRLKSDDDNVRLYIVRDNVRCIYKIGSSVNPMRRYNDLADKQGERDLTLVWYSQPVKRIFERELHQKYSEKRVYGDWFALSETDVKSITSTYEGTYVQRTSTRTENENENENRNIDRNEDREIGGVGEREKTVSRETRGREWNTNGIDFHKPDVDDDELVFPVDSKEIRELWARWKEYRYREHGQRYPMMGEQADLKRLEGLHPAEIKRTILTAMANNWKNLYPEKQVRSNGTVFNKKEQHTASLLAGFAARHGANVDA